MRWLIRLMVLLLSAGMAQTGKPTDKQEQPPTPPTTTVKPIKSIFVPSGATLITELYLTKEDLLPVVAQVFSYFSLQHASGPVISGDELKNVVTAMDALLVIEYDLAQRGVTVADAIKMHQSLIEAQGWQRVFWNRSTKGDRETLVMIEPPRNGLFAVLARERPQALRVIVISTRGQIDVGMVLWLMITFLMRPEQPSPMPITPTSPEKKEQPQAGKPTLEKPTPTPEKPTPTPEKPPATPEKPSGGSEPTKP